MIKTRHTLLLGLAGLGFVLTMPAHATPASNIDFQSAAVAPFNSEMKEGGFVLARQDDNDSASAARRDSREDQRGKSNKKQQTREVDRASESQGYGYGYERRQQQSAPRDDADRSRH